MVDQEIKNKVLYVDIDNTLCVSVERDEDGELDYKKSAPIKKNIDLVNELYRHNTIVLFTARGKRTGKINWEIFTINQMLEWGVMYHKISFDKPHWDLLIDDKAINNFTQLKDFFKA